MLARFVARALGTVALAAVTTISGLTINTASADTNTSASADPSTVTADGLPTVQIDGVAWSQVVVGDTVYVGGSFTTARPAGAAAGVNTVARSNVLAYSLSTGNLIDSFVANTNGEVKSVAASPDGKTIYLGGAFTTVNGTNRYRIAAVNAATGALVTSFAPTADTVVNVIAAKGDNVYFGGNFTTVNNTKRSKLAAVTAANGALLPFTATFTDGTVQGLTVSPDGTKVAIGGSFSTTNGSSSGTYGGYGLALLTSDTGTMLPLSVNTTIRDAGTQAAITSLTSDANGFYGTGYNYTSRATGFIEGTFSADWNGNERWLQDCHGDSYSAAVSGNVIYTASHHHHCGNANGFPQTNPWTYNRATAATTYATGVNQREMYGYADHEGEPAPSELNWFPNINTGSYTGLSQGPWSVAASPDGNYVVYGGEFTTVNGTAQQGLVRFAVAAKSVNKQGPRIYGSALTISARSSVAGQVRVVWPGNYDRDDSTLTYQLQRDSATNVVSTQTQTAKFWNTQQMSFTDTGLTPGQTYQYRLKVSDPWGNSATSSWVSVTVASSGAAPDAYAQKVLDLGASTYYRLDDSSSTAVADTAGLADASSFGALTSTSGAVLSDTAKTFDGSTNDLVIAPSATAAQSPNTFTEAIWFKTNSYGKLAGFGNSTTTANSSSYDRQLYMDSNGYLNFGVYDGANRVITSSTNYKDNSWHFAVATLGSDGMKLYVDGKLAAERGDVTQGTGYTGYWHVGGDAVWSGKNRFTGSLDDFSAFPTALTASQIASLYTASGRTATIATAPADTYGSTVFNDNPNLYWRLGESSGTTAADSSTGNKPGTIAGNVTLGVAGASPTGVTAPDKAITLGAATSGFFGIGSKAAGTVTAARAVYAPRVFTEEVWIKTNTTTGGRILGFGSGSGTSTSSTYDRALWMLNSGQVSFGVGTSASAGVQLTSTKALNDNQWHHVVATFGAVGGEQLYVDGVLDKSSTQIVTPSYYSGYWRVGADATWGGNSTSSFAGTVDEAAVYASALTAKQVKSHYTAAGFQVANAAPTASFTPSVSGLSLSVDGSASTDSDGSVVSYAWDFGDGTTGTGATAGHLYAAGGSYPVKLTVTDDGGASTTTSQTITVNAPPVASFTSTAKKLVASFDASASTDSDGTVTGYAWDFGDGSAAGTGVTPTHTYAAAGTYNVTLTVTDNGGAITTKVGTVTVVADQAPVASFTSSGSGLTANFDGSGSTDADGDAITYAWDFGDGTTGTGATISHTYAAAGTYTVKLTVTDSDGVTGTKTGTYTATAASTIVQDLFSRTTNSGWGNADLGGAWTVSGGAANYKVDGSRGMMSLNVPSMTRTALANSVTSTASDVTAAMSLDTVATGNGTQIGLLGRSIDANDNYIGRIRLGADGTVRLQIVKTVAGTPTTLKDVAVSGITHTAGQVYDIRLQTVGNATTGVTTLNAKVWVDGTTEPTSWQTTVTDNTAALQAAGAVGAWAYVSGSSTNTPQKVYVDNFVAKSVN